MDQQPVTREEQYRQIMDKALEQAPEQPVLPVAPAEASFFFPWEYSRYRANGTTSAEYRSDQG